MWVCLNNSFVSIVEDARDSSLVTVRGRRIEDVQNFVGDAYKITQTDQRDYRFRATVSKFDLSKMFAKCADKIDYGNFKDSVCDIDLKYFYSEIWASGIRNLDPHWDKRHYY